MTPVELKELACRACCAELAKAMVQEAVARGAHIDLGEDEWDFEPAGEDHDEREAGELGHLAMVALTDANAAITWLGHCKCGHFNATATVNADQPPVACNQCHTPIRKFLQPGATWHPCEKCGGVLCERCCESRQR